MAKQDDILKMLVDETLITPEQVTEVKSAADFTKKSVEEILIERNIVDEEELTKIKAKINNFEYANLIEKRVSDDALNTIPLEVSENYNIVCFEKSNSAIKVGMVYPENFKAIEAVDFLAKGAGLRVEYFIISKQSFKVAYKQYKSLGREVTTALKNREEEKEKSEQKIEKVEQEEVTKSAPVAKIVSVIIRHAVDGRASDIHIEPMMNETRVRYRIDGILHTSLVLPQNVHNSIVARIKVMANLKLDETRIPQDGRIRLTIDNKDYDFRISILPLINSEKIVMRILDVSKKAPTLEELGFQGAGLKTIQKNLKRTDGMLIVAGPTGSGKSTTLFSIITRMNKEGINISTLEDPVEYQIKGVNQSQVRAEVGFTFASGLRSLLRQDPDVIMVGEIRDSETAELAIHSALTGHFVLSTVHTIDAPNTITRLLDMGSEPFLLGTTIHTVIAQRLARKICEHCKVENNLPEDFKDDIMTEVKKIPEDYLKSLIKDFDIDNLKFYKGKGCPRCGNSGYSGRISIAEVMDITDKLQEMIINGHTVLTPEDIMPTQNFINFKQDGYLKVIQGFTTIEEILRVIAT